MCTCNYAITYVFPYIFSSVAQRMEGCQEWWLQLKYGITPLLGVHAMCEGCFEDVLVFRDFPLSWNGWHWVCWRCAIGFHIYKEKSPEHPPLDLWAGTLPCYRRTPGVQVLGWHLERASSICGQHVLAYQSPVTVYCCTSGTATTWTVLVTDPSYALKSAPSVQKPCLKKFPSPSTPTTAILS